MKRIRNIALLVAACLLAAPAAAQEATAQPDPATTWDLSEIYASEADWNTARGEVLAALEQIVAKRGTLGESADALYQALALVSDTSRKAPRVFA